MSRLAVGFTLGVAAAAVPGAPAALAVGVGLALPIAAWRRPVRAALLLAVVAGLVAGRAERRTRLRCPPARPGPGVWVGRALTSAQGAAVPLELEGAGACPAERVWSERGLAAGRRVRIEGVRREGWGRGVVVARVVTHLADEAPGPRWRAVRWRARLVERVRGLYGARAPVVSALVLAHREELDGGLRDDFARTGIAHLLAISGFHVGVVAGLLLALAGALGLGRTPARVSAVLASWAYVLLIGAPDAALRAVLIVTFVAAGRLRGRPASRWGALGSALLILVLLEPSRLGGAGFQLSFAGAGGLAAWAMPLRNALARAAGPRLPRSLTAAVAAAIAATLATAPVVAWHFEQVALLGIPATLLASPLVALALPGAIASVAVEAAWPAAGRFLAGGVGVLLDALVAVATRTGGLSWTSLWVPRSWVMAGAGGTALAWVAARRVRLKGTPRRVTLALAGAAAVVAWPLAMQLQLRGSLEIVALDVGQGDAIALRTPRGRWLLVDAGPPATDRRPPAAFRGLVRRGIHRLDGLVLTHADADHIGGAVEILRRLPVGFVLDPGVPVGKEGYLEVLRAAEARGVPWRRARVGLRWEFDGILLEVVAPDDPMTAAGTNAASVVILLRYGSFEALLTGDAPAAVERSVLASLPEGGVELLKVGHHGSATSTDSLLLARIRPRVGVVSVGRGNAHGHPHPEVVARLERFGVHLLRTDREGTLRIRARADGTMTFRSAETVPEGR